MSKPIQIDNRQRTPGFSRQLSESMRRCVDETLARFALSRNCEVYISLVSPRTVRQLNTRYRNMDAVTDVLSFPTIDWQNGQPGRIETLTAPPDSNIETGRIMLGDIIICFDRAMQQAEDYGHSLMRELCFLTVHGVLHLLGFDHQTPSDEMWMNTMTESILDAFDIVRTKSVVQDDEK